MENIAKIIEMVEKKNLSTELTVTEMIEKTFQPSWKWLKLLKRPSNRVEMIENTFQPSWEPDRFPAASSSSSSCPIPAPENLLLYMSLKVLKIC